MPPLRPIRAASKMSVAMLLAALIFGCGQKPAPSATTTDDELPDYIVRTDTPASNARPTPHLPANTAANAKANTAAHSSPDSTSNTVPSTTPTPEPLPDLPRVRVVFVPVAVPANRDLDAYLRASNFDLGMAMLLLAAVENPDLDLDAAADNLNAIAQSMADSFGEDVETPHLRERLTFELFGKRRLQFLRFDDEQARTDPDLLCFPQVFETRRGNCVSLVTLLLAIVDRVGVGDFFRAATMPRHVYLQVNLPGLTGTVYETSRPNEPWTDAAEARAAGISWPLDAGSPFAKPLDRQQTFSLALNNYALVLAKREDHTAAVKWLDRAVALWPENNSALQNRAGERLILAAKLPDGPERTRMLRQCESDLLAVRKLHPTGAETFFILSRVYRVMGDGERAAKILDEGAALFGDSGYEPHRLKILAWLEAGNGDAALQAVLDAEPHIPTDEPELRTEWHYAHGAALLLLKRIDDARPHLDTALRGPISPAQRTRVFLLAIGAAEDAGKFAVAQDFLKRLMDAHRKNETAGIDGEFILQALRRHGARSWEAAEAGNSPAAAHSAVWAFETAAHLADDFSSHLAVAGVLWKLARHEDAVGHFRKAHDKATTDADRFEALESLALVFVSGPLADKQKLRAVVNDIHALRDAEFRREALIFEAQMVAWGKRDVTRAEGEKMLEFLDRYAALGGKDRAALAQRENLRRALGR